MGDEHAEYGLAVSFPDQSASFVNGYEAGAMDQRMGAGETPIEDACVHTENEEVFRRLAEYRGYAVEWRTSEVEGWSYISLRKIRPQGMSRNPHGLRVVGSASAPSEENT